jgi:hypothetical protein
VFEKRIRGHVMIDEMQCGFRPGKGTTDGILIVRQPQEKHQEKKNLYYGLLDQEKAFDRVLAKVTWWAVRKSGVEEWSVSAVIAMHEGAKTVVRTEDGNSDNFAVKVGLHQV